jgi:hypothetical protein
VCDILELTLRTDFPAVGNTAMPLRGILHCTRHHERERV